MFTDDFDDSFFVEPVPADDKHDAEKKTWEFAWRLRPKSAAVRELPSLALAYYSPRVRRYQTARSEPIPLTIKPRPKAIVAPVAPKPPAANLLELAPWSAERPLHGGRLPDLSPAGWGGVSIVLIAAGWMLGRVLPKRAAPSIDSSRHGAQAMAALRNRLDDPAPIVADYLRRRFALAAIEPSCADIDRALQRAGIAPALRQRWANWHGAIAAARFAPGASERIFVGEFVDDIASLISATEAAK